jgi:uncharacterized protein
MPGFFKYTFTDAVRALQERYGSRTSYARVEADPRQSDPSLGADEIEFVRGRDSFYIATVTSDGWPYIQHRGGPKGFLQVIDSSHVAFSDYEGNRQYMTMGNLQTNDRVALFLIDYPTRTRLKLLGRAHFTSSEDARIERIVRIEIVGWDWNCTQHITPRFTIEQLLSAGVIESK